jgi:hypothetical protein
MRGYYLNIHAGVNRNNCGYEIKLKPCNPLGITFKVEFILGEILILQCLLTSLTGMAILSWRFVLFLKLLPGVWHGFPSQNCPLTDQINNLNDSSATICAEIGYKVFVLRCSNDLFEFRWFKPATVEIQVLLHIKLVTNGQFNWVRRWSFMPEKLGTAERIFNEWETLMKQLN